MKRLLSILFLSVMAMAQSVIAPNVQVMLFNKQTKAPQNPAINQAYQYLNSANQLVCVLPNGSSCGGGGGSGTITGVTAGSGLSGGGTSGSVTLTNTAQVPSATALGQGISATGSGQTYLAGFTGPIPAYLYSGADICVQVAAAAAANPHSDISAVLTLGSNPCSVDPTGAFATTPISVNPPFFGRIFFSCVGTVASKCTLNPQTPWIQANTSVIDFGGVNVTIASQFYAISGTRCWTAGSGGTGGTDNFCGNSSISTLSIVPQSGGNASCAAVTIPWVNSTAGTTAELRGGEFIDNSNFTAPANNGKFRVMPAADSDCPGNPGPSTNSGAGTETFWIWAPDAVSCANPTACGSSATVAGPTALWYQGPRAFDLLGGASGGQECIALSGTPNANNCGIFGAKLLNVGEVHAFGYGMLGYDNSACEEQCLIDNSGSHAIYRISSATYHIWTSVPQNNDSFKHGEDYCNQSKGNCVNDGTAKYGAFHVGMLLWDTWSHGTLEDFTINENTQCGIDVEATGGIAVGYNAVNAIQGIHYQAGSNLGNICVGMQAGASGVNIRQIDSNANNPPLANILLGGSHRPALTALNDWSSTQTYSYATVILPTVNNASNYVFFATISGTSGGSEPNWSGGGCTAYSIGATCSDGSVTWTNTGTHFPNSLGVGTSGINVSTISNQPGAITIFNGASNQSWTCNQVAMYVYASNGYEISDCGSNLPNFANGINVSGGTFTCTGASGCPTGQTNSSTQYAIPYYSGAGTGTALSGLLGPSTLNGVTQFFTETASGSAAAAPVFLPAGVPTDAQTGTTYTIALTDRASYVTFSNASSIAVTLPQAGSTNFANNFTFVGCDIGAGTATITPTTSTISYTTGAAYTSGASTLALTTGQCAFVYSDNTNYFAILRGAAGGSAFPLTVSGTVTSGGIPYFNSTTQESSSGILNTNVLPKGGGAGGAPTNSSITDNATNVTTTDTGGYVGPVHVSNGTTAGFIDFPQGTTSSAVAPCNAATSICIQAPTSVTSQLRVLAGAPATGFSLFTNSSGTMTETISPTSGTLSSGVGVLGTLAINAVLASTVANAAGHFTNLQVVTSLGGTCSTVPIFNVFDGTTNVGSTVTAVSTTQTKGTGTSTAQTLTFAAGDIIGIYISTAGGTCTLDQFIVSAQYSIP